MMTSEALHLTGGCQCGAIRFALTAPPTRVSICHCRMCQKAVGGPFASYAYVTRESVTWTTAIPASFRSSSFVVRDFCSKCGTPLTYCPDEGMGIGIATGAFDRPEEIIPSVQYGTQGRLAWVERISELPGKTTTETMGDDRVAAIVSYQHPDHE